MILNVIAATVTIRILGRRVLAYLDKIMAYPPLGYFQEEMSLMPDIRFSRDNEGAVLLRRRTPSLVTKKGGGLVTLKFEKSFLFLFDGHKKGKTAYLSSVKIDG